MSEPLTVEMWCDPCGGRRGHTWHQVMREWYCRKCGFACLGAPLREALATLATQLHDARTTLAKIERDPGNRDRLALAGRIALEALGLDEGAAPVEVGEGVEAMRNAMIFVARDLNQRIMDAAFGYSGRRQADLLERDQRRLLDALDPTPNPNAEDPTNG